MKNNDNIDDFLSQFMPPKQKGAKTSVKVETNDKNESIDDFLDFVNKCGKKKK